ncbi:MAG: hypothetical protein OSP8Acid_08980 [uncultured Acidilobus sp. OSP8]|jgi:hypothetical protein|nr:MAG: hypothetical protein OSP8Acid_08980 [uncultured Acidilobus sp. OSP8]
MTPIMAIIMNSIIDGSDWVKAYTRDEYPPYRVAVFFK